ncbi:MAG: DOMON domain-containing protein, partial [Planctomycetota bacterium]
MKSDTIEQPGTIRPRHPSAVAWGLAAIMLTAAATAGANGNTGQESAADTTGGFVTVEADNPWAPESFAPTIVVPTAFAARDPILDGRGDDGAWQTAQEIAVPVKWGRIGEAIVKAVYTDAEIFLLVSWPDATRDDQHRPWVWDAKASRYVESPQAEDGLLVSVEGGCDWNPSLLAGHAYDFDAWVWLAARTDPLGQAVDADGSIRKGDIPHLNLTRFESRYDEPVWDVKFVDRRKDILTVPWHGLERQYKRFSPSREVYVRYVPDGIRTTVEFAERLPPPSRGDGAASTAASSQGALGLTGAETSLPPAAPQYRPLELTGDAGDVAAKGHWADGRW